MDISEIALVNLSRATPSFGSQEKLLELPEYTIFLVMPYGTTKGGQGSSWQLNNTNISPRRVSCGDCLNRDFMVFLGLWDDNGIARSAFVIMCVARRRRVVSLTGLRTSQGDCKQECWEREQMLSG